MIRKEAIQIISKFVENDPIVSANGFISRDLFEVFDKKSNFYMIGSMGLASSIGLGIALKKPKRKIYVFDGDGNILMNLGSIVTIGSIRPKNLVHIIFDNNIHESTGGQPTNAEKIKLENLMKNVNYKVSVITNKTKLKDKINSIKKESGPFCLVIKIKKSNQKKSKRVQLKPTEIKNRFMDKL